MVDAIKENLCINKIVGNKTFEITVEGDRIIPDSKPDILSEISTTGNVCIYKREILEGKVRLDGNVNIYLMYVADGENQAVRGFNTNIDFTEILDFPGIESKMTLDENICIKKIECKILNGRKVKFIITLEADVTVFLNENEEMIKEIRGIDDIQLKQVSLNMNSLVGQNSTKTSAKENITISNEDNILEILSFEFDIINKDSKVSYNKILAKADVATRILYLTDERKNKKRRRNNSSYGLYRFSTEFQKMIFVK